MSICKKKHGLKNKIYSSKVYSKSDWKISNRDKTNP